LPTLRALFDAPSTSPLAEVKVANVADLLIELSDVRHPMASKQTSNVSLVVKVEPHCHQSDDIMALWHHTNVNIVVISSGAWRSVTPCACGAQFHACGTCSIVLATQ